MLRSVNFSDVTITWQKYFAGLVTVDVRGYFGWSKPNYKWFLVGYISTYIIISSPKNHGKRIHVSVVKSSVSWGENTGLATQGALGRIGLSSLPWPWSLDDILVRKKRWTSMIKDFLSQLWEIRFFSHKIWGFKMIYTSTTKDRDIGL
jgi:hypothetical protein